MIVQLTKLANKLDIFGYIKESKFIDKLIREAIDMSLVEKFKEGWSPACPNPSCNKPVELDPSVFTKMFVPDEICPHCGRNFSPHDVGAVRKTYDDTGINDKTPFSSGLTNEERGLWGFYSNGFSYFVFRGKSNAEQFLKRWRSGGYDHYLDLIIEDTYKDLDFDISRIAEYTIMRNIELMTGPPLGELSDDDKEYIKRRVGNPGKIQSEIQEKTSKIIPLPDIDLGSSAIVPPGEMPQLEHYKALHDSEEILDIEEKDEVWKEELDGVYDTYVKPLRKELTKRREARDKGIDPDTLADDKIW